MRYVLSTTAEITHIGIITRKLLMTNPTATQTAVNAIYREALVEFIANHDGPADNAEICDGVLGGVMPAEMTAGAMEPFVPALLSLVSDRTFVYYAGDDGTMWTDLFTRATPEVQQRSVKGCQDMEAQMDTTDYDDPTNHRTPAEELAKKLQRASSTVMQDIQALLDMKTQKQGTVH